MAVPYSRIRAVLGGNISSSQSWSTSINVVDEQGGNLTANQGFLDTWVNNRVVNVRDWWVAGGAGNSVQNMNPTLVTLSFLRAYLIPANSDQASLLSEANFGTTLAGNGVSVHPAQTAMVVSTRSPVPGRSGRGRMYLPAIAADLGNNLRFSQTRITGVATATAALIGAFGSSSYQDVRLRAVVASTAGARPIVRVEADDDPDVQRRRSDKILAINTAVVPVTQTEGA